MSAHALLKLLNKFRKRDKMLGKPHILSLFLNLFNKFDNTGAQVIDSVYHITLNLFCNHIFGVKMPRFCHLYSTLLLGSLHNVTEMCKLLSGVWILIHRGIYMSAPVLLNLLNKLGKRDKMLGLTSFLSLFRNKFNKFNNTRARMLDSI